MTTKIRIINESQPNDGRSLVVVDTTGYTNILEPGQSVERHVWEWNTITIQEKQERPKPTPNQQEST